LKAVSLLVNMHLSILRLSGEAPRHMLTFDFLQGRMEPNHILTCACLQGDLEILVVLVKNTDGLQVSTCFQQTI